MRKHGLLGLAWIRLVLLPVLVGWTGVAWADPCGLITREEVQTLLGEEVGEPAAKLVKSMAAGQSCFYATSAPISKRGGKGTLRLIEYDPRTMKEHGALFKSPVKYFHKNLSVMKKHNKGARIFPAWGTGPPGIRAAASSMF